MNLNRLKSLNLYHGSYVCIDRIDLNKSRPFLDFGGGFYLTTSKRQALKWANLVAKRRGFGGGYVTVYRLVSLEGLRVKVFDGPTDEWFDFVIQCRKFGRRDDYFDIIIGPVADEGVFRIVNNYLLGNYGEGQDAKETAKRLLRTERLANQICFCSLRGVSRLKRVGGFSENG